MKTIICFSLASLLLVSGCKKDSPVAADASANLPPSVTTIIGIAGGTLKTTDFLLSISPGTFAIQETLKVTVETGNDDFGTRSLSSAYKIEGIPSTYAHPLHLQLACQRPALSGTFVALGQKAILPSSGVGEIMYRPIPARDSSGFLLADIPAMGAGVTAISRGRRTGTSDVLEGVKWLIAMDQQDTMETATGHFRIFYPTYLEGKVTALAGYLEDAYARYDQMGFNNGAYAATDWPVPVAILKFNQANTSLLGRFVLFTRDAQTHPSWGLRFNEDRLISSTASTDRRTAAYLFSYALFTHTDHFYWVTHTEREFTSAVDRAWPYCAIASWAEEKFVPASEQQTFMPLGFQGQETRIIQGLAASGNETAEALGAAMAGLMEYLEVTYSQSVLPILYTNVHNSTSAVDALLTTISDGPDIWWPGFLKMYFGSGIYNVCSDSLLKQFNTSSGPDQFTIALPSDTAKHFSVSCSPLSAELHKVNLRYPEISAQTSLQFLLSPGTINSRYLGVMLFGMKDKKLEYWAYGTDVRVESIKNLTAAGYDIVAAVVNSSGVSPQTVDLTVRINGGTGDIPLQASMIEKVHGTFTDKNLLTTYENVSYFAPVSATRNGVLSGHTFTASWNGPWAGTGTGATTGSLVLSFDNSSPPNLTAFSLTDTLKVPGYRQMWRLVSNNSCSIPGVLNTDRYVFQVNGSAIGSLLGSIDMRYVQDDGYWRQLQQATPTEGDLIYIVVQKW